MGHGYLAVLGYGILVSIQKFKEKFPELFDDDALYFDEVAFDEFTIDHDISLHYDWPSLHDERDEHQIFITGDKVPMVDARCAEIDMINPENLKREESVETFAKKYFPKAKIGLYLYSYQDG